MSSTESSGRYCAARPDAKRLVSMRCPFPFAARASSAETIANAMNMPVVRSATASVVMNVGVPRSILFSYSTMPVAPCERMSKPGRPRTALRARTPSSRHRRGRVAPSTSSRSRAPGAWPRPAGRRSSRRPRRAPAFARSPALPAVRGRARCCACPRFTPMKPRLSYGATGAV